MLRKILFFLIFCGFLVGGALFYAYQYLSYKNPVTIELTIPKGAGVGQIARILEEKKVIPDALGFKILVTLTQKGKLLKAGDYEFEEGINPIIVLTILVEGQVKMMSLTIPEGYRLSQIEGVLKNQGFDLKGGDWQKLVSNPQWIKEHQIPGGNLEGYLFPNTYLYSKTTTAHDLVNEMVKTFWQKITPEMIESARLAGFTVHQWVTLASIIEKETGVASERPLIARVFLNRLSQGMLLQTDPTVIYGIMDYKGNITRADLERDNPYNTYTRAGLPPGPICSPGLESLKAVLEPAAGPYLYFVAKGDGTHYFSKNLEEHNRAVNYYQRHIGNPP